MNFDDALGIHPQALQLRARRAEVIASNLANVRTSYKAVSISTRCWQVRCGAGAYADHQRQAHSDR
ncbi:flagellar basal body protein [endosymbiont of Lamellibrachia barhami]|uniref:flagellar basal body protein n=1 Tax=endosymbiont of Lamellibrachia barhami TaxID=205975 RepID=UPI001FE55DB8